MRRGTARGTVVIEHQGSTATLKLADAFPLDDGKTGLTLTVENAGERSISANLTAGQTRAGTAVKSRGHVAGVSD
ncbi:MAG: hypothetical protein ACRD12_03065 [Acidimicrobiales bacterium]